MEITLFEESILKESKNSTEKPKCFDLCTDQYCDMQEEHCSNRDFPPMRKCPRCEFWFTNLERKQDAERAKVKYDIKTHRYSSGNESISFEGVDLKKLQEVGDSVCRNAGIPSVREESYSRQFIGRIQNRQERRRRKKK